MVSVAEADRLLAELLPRESSEIVALNQCGGRVLTQDAVADRDGPPFDRVAMDGYAVVASPARTEWTVASFQPAGTAPHSLPSAESAIETATGAVLPHGCNAVIPYERTSRTDDQIRLNDDEETPAFRHIHRQGSDYRQGDVLLPAGTALRSVHLHTLASIGVETVRVRRRMRWSLAATGDELVEIGSTPQPWQIRRSNGAALQAEASAWGLSAEAQVVLPDDPARLRRGIETLLNGLDVLVLTGGVSAGALDLVPQTLVDLGFREVFRKIAQRPGKPLWCGVLESGNKKTLAFGLPGNPVSCLFAFRRYVIPWLLAAEGSPAAEQRVRVEGLKKPSEKKTQFLPWSNTQGVLEWQGSGNFSALSQSSGFLELDDDPRSWVEPRVYPWGGL